MASLPGFTHANSGTSYYALKSEVGAVSNWSQYPAVSAIDAAGNVIKNISSLQIDAQVLTADASDLLLNGVPIATITSISNVEDWALFPAVGVVDMAGFNLSGAGAGSFTSLNVSGSPVVTNATISGSVSQWATFGAVTDVNLSGNAITSAASVQVGNRTLTTAAGTADAPYLLINGSNVLSNWASFTAGGAVSLGGNDINNVKDITSSGTTRTNAVITNNLTLSTAVITTLGPNVLVNGVNSTSNWASFQANASLDMAGFPISNTPSVSISGTTQNVVLTAAGTQLLVDGQPVFTGSLPPSDTANWANYPAVANVNMSGKAIQSTTDLSLQSGGSIYLASSSNIKVQTKMETRSIDMTGLVSQSFAGGGCNFFQSAVQIGTNGILPTDKFGSAAIYGVNTPAGFSSLYVSGGTTLDGGGTVHGITIGTQPVLGINTVRIDVLPVGMLLTSPTFITMNGLGAANIAMGGAVAIGAGSYVTLEHGGGLGANGIFLQNTARDGQCKVIMTGGGTFYNATFVQSSNIINPNGVTFWDGVYNPSGGSAPIAPTAYGRAVVDISSAGCYLANLTSGNLPATKNSNSVFIGNFPNLTTSGATSTIAIGDISGMTGQGANSIAIGTEAGANSQGANAVAIGFTAGSTSQDFGGVAIGNEAAFAGQRANAVAIGTYAGRTSQGVNGIAIGFEAGSNTQGSNSIAIGWEAGQENQGTNSVAIGLDAAITTQGTGCVAVGASSGSSNQGAYSVAVGTNAGSSNLGSNSVAVGTEAAAFNSGTYITALGYQAGRTGLGSNSIAVGAFAGSGGMGEFSTYIGTTFTAEGAVPTKTIVLNNTGLAMNPANANAFYVGKITSQASGPGFNMVAHNNGTGEFIQTLTSSLSMDSTISNTQRISYDTGLLTTAIDGILQVNGNLEVSQTANLDSGLNVLGLTTLSSLVIQNISAGTSAKAVYYNPSLGILTQADAPTEIVAQPAFVYYVATNGRAGASGAITDPFSTINEALTKPASTATDKPGMTIYVAPGEYNEDVVINLTLTLPAVAIIGMGDDTDDSKRVQIRGSVAIGGTFVGAINTINVVILNNLAVLAKNATTSAVSITGAGVRTYLKNGLYTTAFVATTIPLISLSSTGATANTINQLVIDNCSMSIGAATASANIINVASGQIFQILFSDITNLGTGLCINMAGGAFTEATQTRFNARNGVLNIVSSATALTSLTQCLVSGRASTSVALITLGTNANLNINDNTIQNLDTTTEVNNTSRYIYTTSATGNFIAAIRNNITNSRAAATQITPFQAAVPAASQLLYFGNIYTNSTATLVGNLPQQGGANWNAVRQFNTDTYTQQIQVVATSASAIVLTPTARGKTFILTGTTTQAFSTAGFGVADTGFFVIAHNGNATGGGDINLTGMTGTNIIHERKTAQNGGDVYLYWNGTGLVGY